MSNRSRHVFVSKFPLESGKKKIAWKRDDKTQARQIFKALEQARFLERMLNQEWRGKIEIVCHESIEESNFYRIQFFTLSILNNSSS